MTTAIKLTDTQANVLTAAVNRPDGNIEPLPPTLRGGARTKVIEGLLARELVCKQESPDGATYHLSDAGYAAVGRTRLEQEPLEAAPADAELDAIVNAREAEWQGGQATRRTRENSKQAQVLAMLGRPEGATVKQIMGATGWLAHTVRGTFAGAFKKKLGLAITSEKPDDGERVYRIQNQAA